MSTEPSTRPSTARGPWHPAQLAQLLRQRGHAWLLHGPSGLGQYPLALDLARAWLCEQPTQQGGCGHCASCHAIAVRAHADLCVLMPEVQMLALGWPLPEKAQTELDDKKRKPSKEVRVEAMRDAVEFAQRTSSRGRGKVVLVYPAEAMNTVTANALLKTLEEPPGDVRFILACDAAHQLLPTVRSRCQAFALRWPDAADAHAWLMQQGVGTADATTWLRAAGGRAEDALALAQAAQQKGMSATQWAELPRAAAQGRVTAFEGLEPPQLIATLQKICHDAAALAVGAAPRFFDAAHLDALPPARLTASESAAALRRLTQWGRALTQSARSADHPYNAGLLREALVTQARAALAPRPSSPRAG